MFVEPPCCWFSQLLRINWKRMPVDTRERGIAAAVRLFEFGLLLAHVQLKNGRAVVLEHPLTSSAWRHPRIQQLRAAHPELQFADFDFCMFGMVTKVARTPVKKPIRLMTNVPQILDRFRDVRCDGNHDHEACWGVEGGEKRSQFAQIYPPEFCACLANCCASFVA